MNCQQHLSKNYSSICLSEGCKCRLLCDDCQHQQNHFLIPIQELNQKITEASPKWIEPKLKPVLEFLKQNNQTEINTFEIENQLQYIFDIFIQEITIKLREQQNYLSNQLIQLSKNALKNINYLKYKIEETYNLKDIYSVLQKYQTGVYSKETFEQIIKDYSIKINGNTEIQNIYQYITNNGTNHNYLDLIQIDLKQFHLYKSNVLSNLARLQDLDNYLPIKYKLLPTKAHAIFSWNIVKGQKEHSFNIQNIRKTMAVDEIHSFKTKIICVINQAQIISYSHNYKFLNLLHSTQLFDFYLATNIQSDIQMFTLWSAPTKINICFGFRKIKIINNAALNPIAEIKLINKYNLYQKGYESLIMTLDSNGILKVNTLSDNEYYNFTYGSGIQRVAILPETKNALKKSLSHTQDAILDLVVCSYQKNQIKLAIRSLFQAQPLSRIWDDETLEQKLGLVEHCDVQFQVFKLSFDEKIYLKDKMDVDGIDYLIVTLLNSSVAFWNWKTGLALRVVDAAESYGLRTMPAIVDGILLTFIVLIGLDGIIYSVNWLKSSVTVSKLKISDVVQIHAMSQNLQKLGESQFVVVLRHQKRPFMTVTELIYY